MGTSAGLNDVQRAAVEAGDGPILIFAGAGSGKTRVLTHRIAYLLTERGVPPEQILAVTFTNKAAGELKCRLATLAGEQAYRLTVGTFHAICARFLRHDIHHLGWDHQFTIYDEDDQSALVKEAMKRLDLDEKHFSPRSVLGGISRAKNHMVAPLITASRAESYFEEIVHRVYRVYNELLQENNALDFDDLLLFVVKLFEEHPAVLARYHRRYRYLLVDEFQDTNPPQYELVKLLGKGSGNVLVVGDDDQSIYRFRGAVVGNILSFERDFPGAQVFKLEQNYRSTGHILAAAQAVVERNPVRTDKTLWTALGDGELITFVSVYNEQEEGRFIAREVRRLEHRDGVRPSQCAVLYRTNAQSRSIEEAFLREGTPYRLIGGTRFYDRKEVRDVLAYLRLANNGEDSVAFGRILNVPPRGLGPRTLTELQKEAGKRGVSLRGVLAQAAELTALGTRTQRVAGELHQLLTELRDAADRLPVPELLSWLLEHTGYAAYLRDGTPEGEERWTNVLELHTVAQDFAQAPPRQGLEGFLEQVALVAAGDERDPDKDSVTLITLHAAKGLEFPVVFMVGMEEGLFPNSRAIDQPEELAEERRLCYVGMTRAMRRLYLTTASTRTLYGKTMVNEPSRFLGEIPAKAMQRQGAEPLAWPLPEAREAPASPGHARSHRAAPPPRLVSSLRPAARIVSGNGRLVPPPAASNGTTPAAAPAPVSQQYQAGQKVHHKIFGEGIVVQSELRGGDEEVSVAFVGQGVKKLAASLAPLVKL